MNDKERKLYEYVARITKKAAGFSAAKAERNSMQFLDCTMYDREYNVVRVKCDAGHFDVNPFDYSNCGVARMHHVQPEYYGLVSKICDVPRHTGRVREIIDGSGLGLAAVKSAVTEDLYMTAAEVIAHGEGYDPDSEDYEQKVLWILTDAKGGATNRFWDWCEQHGFRVDVSQSAYNDNSGNNVLCAVIRGDL